MEHNVLVAQATNGEWYYVVRARNGRTLSMSELYVRRGNAVRAARKLGLPVKERLPDGKVVAL